jgi:hypothetical protein
MAKSILTAVLLFACGSIGLGQRSSIGEFVSPPDKPAREIDSRAREDFSTFFGLVDRILALKETRSKVVGSVQLADLLWKYDEPAARQLIGKSFELASANGDANERETQERLRQHVLVVIAKHDSAWAKRLLATKIKEDVEEGSNNVAETATAIASTLVSSQPDLAIDFAKESLQIAVDPSFVWFLKELRVAHAREADELFLQALSAFRRQPVFNPNDLAMLGNYVFTSPRNGNQDSPTVVITRVGNVGIADITADRPGIPPSLIQNYLSIAAELLNRPIADAYQRQSAYALTYLLLAKARVHAPEILPLLSAALTSMTAGVPPAMTDASAFSNFTKSPLTITERLAGAAQISDARKRDLAYLDVAYHAWRIKDFRTARLAADKISDDESANSLRTVIDFGASASLLEHAQSTKDAEIIAAQMAPGIERSILFLGIARKAAKDRNASKQIEALGQALQAARVVNDVRGPFLLLIAAGELASLQPELAESVLSEAVTHFNQYDDEQLSSMSWYQTVEIGPLSERFPLAVAGVDFAFGPAFYAALSIAGDNAELIAAGFKAETLQVQALIEVGRKFLERLADQERVVRVGEDGIRKSALKSLMPLYPQSAVRARQQGTAVAELHGRCD